MIRKLACAVAVMVVAVGFVVADTVTCKVESIDKGVATCQKYTKAKKGQKAEKEGETFKVTIPDGKIFAGKFNKDTKKVEKADAISADAFSEMVKKASDKGGVTATITHEGGKASEVIVQGGKKKKTT